MMSKEEFREFRQECGNYFFYVSRLAGLRDRHREIYNRMSGVSSIPMDRISSGTKTSSVRSDTRILNYLERKDSVEQEIAYYSGKIASIVSTIDGIPDPPLRPMVWMALVQGKTIDETAQIYGMKTATVRRRINSQFIEE